MKTILSSMTMLVLVLTLVTACVPAPPVQPGYPYPSGPGYGPGGMMGPGGSMMPGYGPGGIMRGRPGPSAGQRITIDQAVDIVKTYLRNRNDPNLKADEIIEFQYNFYVEFIEASTGIHAYEALIDPYTGDMYPEPGPNMMWNTRYGMMSGMMWGTPGTSAPMTLTSDNAKKLAEDYLSVYLPGVSVEEVAQFYGYYTVDLEKDGRIYGMLSVNGYTGQVWFHFWHGAFVGEKAIAQ